MTQSLSKFARFAWAVLAYNIFVILFGAFVRATGSGAGCGAHWPLCNGVVIPRPQQIETVIEFTHRLTSGITLVLVVILAIWAWRLFPKGSLVRTGSALVLFFTITEALVGAGLVLFRLVADNASVYRAFSVMIHLVNTFLLIGCLAATAWWASDGAPEQLTMHQSTGWLLIAGAAAILLLGASGAVTALGDTLFPSTSLAQGFLDDFSAASHWLVQMRVFHPGIAIGVGFYLALVTVWVRRKGIDPRLEAITMGMFVLYGIQIIAGIINVALLAPVWMQIVHLLISNLVWVNFVLMAVVVFDSPSTIQSMGRAPSLLDHQVHDRVNQAKEVR